MKKVIIEHDGETYIKVDKKGLNARAKELKRLIGIKQAIIKVSEKEINDWTEELNEILDAGGEIIDEKEEGTSEKNTSEKQGTV